MNELTLHIQKLNAKTQAWVAEDPENRWASFLVDDPAHWAEYKIFTVDQFDHYMAAIDLYEATREKYGYKPSWSHLMQMTTEQLIDGLKKI
jgi:hypothetical protein